MEMIKSIFDFDEMQNEMEKKWFAHIGIAMLQLWLIRQQSHDMFICIPICSVHFMHQ